jgi:hypothetical protein
MLARVDPHTAHAAQCIVGDCAVGDRLRRQGYHRAVIAAHRGKRIKQTRIVRPVWTCLNEHGVTRTDPSQVGPQIVR